MNKLYVLGREALTPEDEGLFLDLFLLRTDAMTRENLNSKSDIAAELAWRDLQIIKPKGLIDATE